MKKILQLVAGMVLSAGLMTGVAAAQSSISTTGPGSTNAINNTQTSVDTRICTNTVNATNLNNQNASSGTSNVSGNTVGGSATTGTASNTNSTSTNVNTDCGGCPTCSNQPGGGGGGQGVGQQGGQGGGSVSGMSTTAVAAGVTALPETGASDVVKPIALGLLALGSLAAIAQLSVSGYRRLALGA